MVVDENACIACLQFACICAAANQQLENRVVEGEPRDAAVNFDTYRISHLHRSVSLPQHGFLVYSSNSSKC